ncbi:MAG: four-carbon acid sugar kinase family protein, partial [Candidatus Sericytochromatia bacterium]
MLRRPRLGIVADGLLASSSIGAMFARRGWATRVLTEAAELDSLADRLRNRCTDVVVIDTDAHFHPPDEAARRVERATHALFRWGADIYYNETCLVGPGRVGAYFDTMLGALGRDFGLAVAALPRHGQVTVNGLHYLDGRLLSEAEYAAGPPRDPASADTAIDLSGRSAGAIGVLPLATVRAGTAAVRAHLDEARGRHLRHLLADARTPADLVALAHTLTLEPVLLGSSGLVEELVD